MNFKNIRSFSIILVVAAITIASTPACGGDGSGITIRVKGGDVIPTYSESEVTKTRITTYDSGAPTTDQTTNIIITTHDSVPVPCQQPQAQVPQIIVVTQQVVVVQPVAPTVVVKRPCFIKRLFGWGHASAYASVSVDSYDRGYYPTYWDYNTSYGERYNYHNTQRMYGGGYRYGGHGGGYRYGGGGYNNGSPFIQNHVPPGGLYPYQQGPLVRQRH